MLNGIPKAAHFGSTEDPASSPHQHFFLRGGGTVGSLMRNWPWSNTPFGHPDSWSPPLRSSISLCLNSPMPACVFWGPQLYVLYNDAWSRIPGARHPGTLGQPAEEVLVGAWSEISAMLHRAMHKGESGQVDDFPVPITHEGLVQECYFTHTSSPICSEDGASIGIFVGLIETTPRVLSERRARVLQGLSSALAAAVDSSCIGRDSTEMLGRFPQDFPLVAFYSQSPTDSQEFIREAIYSHELTSDAATQFAPASLKRDVRDPEARPLLPSWAELVPFRKQHPPGSRLFQMRSDETGVRLREPSGSPMQLLVIPLPYSRGAGTPPAFFLCGLDPRLRIDEGYTMFVNAVASSVNVALQATRQRELERQRAEVYRLALDTGCFGTWTYDPATQEITFSDRARELFGYASDRHSWKLEEAVGRYHPEEQPLVRRAFQHAMEERQELNYEARLNLADGSERWLWVRGSFYQDAFGAARFTGLVGDTTERRHADDLLRETEKLAAAGRLAATIAHEINNPLESVTNLIYLASLDESLSESTAKLLQHADAELSRVTHIAQQTLGFYRDTLGPVRVNIQELVSETVAIFERRPESRSLQVDYSRVQPVWLTCLQGELRQVLSNLIANAMHATEQGEIRITARLSFNFATRQPVLRLTVADSGSGIEKSNRKKLFTAFFTTKREIGNGLGLWVSKNILEKQGGSIRFRSSTGDRCGTSFMITLPIRPFRSTVQ